MSLTVFLVVLFGAALHASWNAIVKGGSDKLLTTVLIAAASGLVAIVVLPFLAVPAPARRWSPSPAPPSSASTCGP